MNKNLAIALLSAGVLGLTVVSFWRPASVRSQTGSSDGQMQFRVMVGLTDVESKQWKGRLSVTGGQVEALQGWRFTGQDKAASDGEFEFQTRIGNFENQLRAGNLYGQTGWNDPNMQRLIPSGLIVRVRGSGTSRVRFASPSGTFEFSASDVPYDMSRVELNGNAVIERLPVEEKISATNKADDKADDQPAIAIGPNGQRWIAWLAYKDKADEVLVSDGATVKSLSAGGDHHGPAIAHDGKGNMQVVWARRFDAEYHLLGTSWSGGKWGRTIRLASTGGSHIAPVLASDGNGRLALVWQCLRGGSSRILARIFDGSSWGIEQQVNTDSGNAWAPAASFGGGKLWVAWDSYATGTYQVYARANTGGAWTPVQRVTRGDNFSVRPSVAVTAQGAPVIAWEESDALWGKDFTFLKDRRGTTLYKNRRIRLANLEGSQWKEPVASVETALPEGMRRFIQQPQLRIDEGGRLYLAFRARTSAANARMDFWASGGRWESFLTWSKGNHWARAVSLPASTGRNGMRVALAVAGGQVVHIAWPTDNRSWPGNAYGNIDIYAARLIADAPVAALRDGRPLTATSTGPPAGTANAHLNEASDTNRIRNYRVEINGRRYRIVRGDLHRHTELSGDGAGDGSLDDLYRYNLDAAAMDYAHVADHQMGNGEDYNWWITQKSNDLYYMPQRFVPLYGYERSLPFPNGHRNVIWAQRGKPVLPIGAGERKGEVNTGSVLYPYLKQTDGIVTSHTSATQQGTDWRDNDPELEPFVEIYQGFESSYEHAGAPRAWKEGESAIHQGLRPQGYVWNAWAKGLKLGVQSSSDHVSTHSSYACILVEEFTRPGLVDAMRKRHTYAATDSIVMDYRIVTKDVSALMGDIVNVTEAPKLQVRILGTAPIRQVDIIRNNTYVHKLTPNQADVKFEYLDAASTAGEAYYYVRAEQTDGQLVWSSPIWVRRM
ncbi:MAG: hypothetical protein JJE04_13715 [Acidobacteriia bacterium]|nr:hypothetical protein [Terriglobia bacterium]